MPPGTRAKAKLPGRMTAESREQEPLDDHRAPERTLDQRMDALSKANEVRARRAQLKRDLKSGRVSLAALMVDPPLYLETAKVLDMLLALPGHGRVKPTKILLNSLPSLTQQDVRRARRAPAQGARHAPGPLICVTRQNAFTRKRANRLSADAKGFQRPRETSGSQRS